MVRHKNEQWLTWGADKLRIVLIAKGVRLPRRPKKTLLQRLYRLHVIDGIVQNAPKEKQTSPGIVTQPTYEDPAQPILEDCITQAVLDTSGHVNPGPHPGTRPADVTQFPAPGQLNNHSTPEGNQAILQTLNQIKVSIQALEGQMTPGRADNSWAIPSATPMETGFVTGQHAPNASFQTRTSHQVEHQDSRLSQQNIPSDNHQGALLSQPGMRSQGFATNLSVCDYGVHSDSLPRVHIVSPTIRKEITSGKDINLACLISPGCNTTALSYDSLQVCSPQLACASAKPDRRLSKHLNIQQFITAFNMFKSIMCETYPHRRPELDAYLSDIIEMSALFGPAFYEYHLAFSARAATLLQNYNIKIDWSKRDTHIFSTVFAGRRAATCLYCQSSAHFSDFCPLQSSLNPISLSQGSRGFGQNSRVSQQVKSSHDVQGRPRVFLQGKEVCNNFNTAAGCVRSNCNLLHACLQCKLNSHGASTCQSLQKAGSDRKSSKSTSPLPQGEK